MWPFTLSLPNPDPVWKVLPSKKNADFLKHCVWMDTKFRCNMIQTFYPTIVYAKRVERSAQKSVITFLYTSIIPNIAVHTAIPHHPFVTFPFKDPPQPPSKNNWHRKNDMPASTPTFQASPLTNFRVMELLPRWPEPSFWAPNGSLVGFLMVLCSETFCNFWWSFEICLSVSNKLWHPGPRP